MRKLTEKTRFKISEDGATATIFAKKPGSSVWEPVFICHPATIQIIKEQGLNKTASLLRPFPSQQA